MREPKPFTIAVSDQVLDDLSRRLHQARLPGAPQDAGWHYGVNPDYFARLITYWRESYDWRRAEAELNRFSHFKAPVALGDDSCVDVHFIHEQGDGDEALPLLLLHGWPGSIFEFQEVIAPLTHPAGNGGDLRDNFDVVVPSLPGYGFSEAPPAPIGPRQIAGMMHHLMREVLGYQRYAVQGGDWGALIAAWMALDYGGPVAAVHLNMTALRPPLGAEFPAVTAEEKTWIDFARTRMRRETAYQDVHATKSQSLAYGLTDSPVGLAAWIVEKFHAWSDDRRAEPPFNFDQLLTNVMIYWINGAMNSSTWLYRAARESGDLAAPRDRQIEVPCAYLLPPHDLVPPPPTSWLERIGKVTRRTDLATGGHFVALENGPQLIEDVRSFCREHAR